MGKMTNNVQGNSHKVISQITLEFLNRNSISQKGMS